MSFNLQAPWLPCGDQPRAIQEILSAYKKGDKEHTLLGVTGSGKTFTMAHVIAQLGVPALIIAPNKTLAGQLFAEFREFFPDNPVEFFISYYDYYQPEAYVPKTDTYIAKDASINEDIDKMRHRSTQSLFEKPQVIIIASVSCIYGLGSPETYSESALTISVGNQIRRKRMMEKLIDLQYSRNDVRLTRGHFRLRGEIFDIMPAHEKELSIRVEFFGDEIEDIKLIQTDSGECISSLPTITLYPNSHYIMPQKSMKEIITQIQDDLQRQLQHFKEQGKLVEYQRLQERTLQDIESFEAFGYCSGIENYSRYLSGKSPGEPPPTLLDYFPDDFITIIDESHLGVPQLHAMYRGDYVRKRNLVDFGFRLPSAMDNRPLEFSEFKNHLDKVLYVSATPGTYELKRTPENISEQIIRPTGLVDPEIIVRRASQQMDDLYSELKKAVKIGKAFVLTLTQKMAEDLSVYLENMGLRVRYLHAQVNTLERSELLAGLRKDEFDILVGINLLREGLDVPEVALVAILDADKEGFLRSKNSLIQMVGRAARNVNARVIFYADTLTQSIKGAMEETQRRRHIQQEYNKKHGIQPQTVAKKMSEDLRTLYGLSPPKQAELQELPQAKQEVAKLLRKKEQQMKKAAGELRFEKAYELKQEIAHIKSSL